MLMETLRHIAPFDSKPSAEYVYPSDEDLYVNPDKDPMYERMKLDLFKPGFPHTMVRNNLRMQVRLLLNLVLHNVMPRRGDRTNI